MTIKSKPIIFSGEMVRAILEGRKSQTRMVIKVQPSQDDMQIITLIDSTSKDDRKNIGRHHWVKMDGLRISASDDVYFSCPYQVGDLFCLKETWQIADWTEEGDPFVRYKATGDVINMGQHVSENDWECVGDMWADLSHRDNYLIDNKAADRKWRSPILMPKWASRITLEITNVRAERLQDISEEDAIADGIEVVGGNYSCSPWRNYELKARDKIKYHFSSPIRSYQSLWESLHGKGSWDENPWLWVLEFRRTDAPRP